MNNNFIKLLLLLVPVYFIGFGIDVMDIDASQYAEMSREMSLSNSYLQVYEIGKDYLDKPPLLFWVTSLSMKIFGANNFAYRFPSFLFALVALFSTYKFALLYYKKEIAALAALVLASCQAFYLMNHDVKTDTILMGCVMFSVWQFSEWFNNKKLTNVILAFIGIGFGMLSKGPVALIVPILAFGSHIILQRNFTAFFKWQYLLGIIIVALILLPMSYGLYTQFDLQPNKLVNNKTGVSGLRFFYWTQSFGRITGESIWNNNSNIFFLLQNMLWAFLPWIVVFLIALYHQFKKLVQQRFKIAPTTEWICTGGFVLTYLALGSSRYQLPHYIFVALPFASVITASFLWQLYEHKHPKLLAVLEKSHFVLFTLLLLALLFLISYSFPAPIWLTAGAVILVAVFLVYFSKKNVPYYLIKICVVSFFIINLFLNAWVYPSLLKYQAGNSIGRFIAGNNLPLNKIFIYKEHIWHSLHFYSKDIIRHKDSIALFESGDYVILPDNKLDEIKNSNFLFDVVYSMETYSVSRLKIKFLIPSKRNEITEKFIVIKIK